MIAATMGNEGYALGFGIYLILAIFCLLLLSLFMKKIAVIQEDI